MFILSIFHHVKVMVLHILIIVYHVLAMVHNVLSMICFQHGLPTRAYILVAQLSLFNHPLLHHVYFIHDPPCYKHGPPYLDHRPPCFNHGTQCPNYDLCNRGLLTRSYILAALIPHFNHPLLHHVYFIHDPECYTIMILHILIMVNHVLSIVHNVLIVIRVILDSSPCNISYWHSSHHLIIHWSTIF